MKFINKVIQRLEQSNSYVCVGLDSRYDLLPENIKKGKSISEAIFAFNKGVIDATHHVAGAYKSNVAFYAGFGAEGLKGLELTNAYLQSKQPIIPVIADCKRSEMGESVKMVRQEIFEWLHFDAIMVTPWFGFDTVRDYLIQEENGVIVYAHDSNPTAAEFQDVILKDGRALYEMVTETVANKWDHNGNLFVEAGLTYPKELKRVRQIIGEEMPLLVAGMGSQGGKAEDLKGLFGKNKKRLLVNSSRGIIFPPKIKRDYFDNVKIAAESIQTLIASHT